MTRHATFAGKAHHADYLPRRRCEHGRDEVGVGPKTLRKTYVTLATFAGLDRLAIQGNVGHSGEEMTERYAWVSTDEKRKVTEAIEGLVPSRG